MKDQQNLIIHKMKDMMNIDEIGEIQYVSFGRIDCSFGNQLLPFFLPCISCHSVECKGIVGDCYGYGSYEFAFGF